MTIYLAVIGLLTVFYTLLVASLFYERWLLTFTILFALPVLLGTTFLVQIGIVIIVARNGEVFLGDGTQSVAVRHTGDFIVHTVPIGMLLITLVVGLLQYVRRFEGYQLGLFRTRTRRWLYNVYWVFCALVPLAIYSACFDISEKYPTGIPTGYLWLMLIAVNIVWMVFLLGAFTAAGSFAVEVSAFWRRRGERDVEAAANDQTVRPARAGISEVSNGGFQRATSSAKALGGLITTRPAPLAVAAAPSVTQ